MAGATTPPAPGPVPVHADETLDRLAALDLRIIQKKRGYRFSLDPILLADFATVRHKDRVADLGTGCGVAALVIARRKRPRAVVGFEIQESLWDLAERNVALNGLAGQVEIVRADLSDWRGLPGAGSFGVVVANPPFRAASAGALSPVGERAAARHLTHASMEDFARSARHLLEPRGRAAFIHPADKLTDLFATLRAFCLEPSRLRCVHTYADSPAALVLVEGRLGARPRLAIERPLVLYEEAGRQSAELRAMYLKA